MQRPTRLAILFPAIRATPQLPAISQVNEYQFSANTLTIILSKYTFLGRIYPYYTTTQPQTT